MTPPLKRGRGFFLPEKEMKMKKPFRALTFVMLASLLGGPLAYAADETPTASDDSLEVEKLKLQIEELKLENQRLQLQIKTMQLGTSAGNPTTLPSTPTVTPTPVDKGGKKVAKDMAEKAEALAQQYASDDRKVVLDFSNGEMYYKGVHYDIMDFNGFCEDQKWGEKPKFVKYDISGDSMYRYQYHNMSLSRYDAQTLGVFTVEAPQNDGDFTFITPETVTETSRFYDFRNHFETAYFKFSEERKQDGYRVIRFRHYVDFLGFDDVLEFWFDTKDNFAKLKWGTLDKK